MARIDGLLRTEAHVMNVPLPRNRGRQQPLVWLTTLFTLGLFPFSSLLAAGKLSPDLGNLPHAASLDVIVQFVSPPTAADLAKITQAGGRIKAQFRNIPDVVITL